MKKRILYKLIMIVALSMVAFYGCSKVNDKDGVDISAQGNDNQAVITDTVKDQENDKSDKVDVDLKTPTGNEENSEDPEITEENTVATDGNIHDAEKEDILFSFQVKDSDKYVTVSTEKSQQNYLIYRFGTKENVELAFPEARDNAWDQFTYSYYMRGGGTENEAMDLNYLEFENGGYLYKIYEEYVADGETVVGILVTNKDSKEESKIEGDTTTVEGSLIPLRDSDKIQVILQ